MSNTLVRRLAPHALLALLVGVTYGMALKNGYVWDDRFFLTDYAWVGTFREAFAAALQPLFGYGAYFRPLPLLTLYVEAIASGRNPAISHLTSLVLHFLCGVLVFLLARRAMSESAKDEGRFGTWLPLALASLFVVHPALSEAVLWVSSRFDLMATLFMLLALWVAGNDRLADWPRALWIGACFFLAALSKESAAVLPLVLGGYALLRGAARRGGWDVRFADGFSPRELKSYGVLLVTGLLYLVIRLWMLEGARPMGMQTLPADEHLVRVASALSKYLQLTFVPFVGNSPHHSFKWAEQASLAMYWPQLLASFVLLAGITVLVARRHLVGWWLLVWLAAYLPVMQLVPLEIGSNIIHQRFMYFPTAVLLALSPYAVSKLQLTESAKRFAAVLASLAVAISIVLCWSIIPVWRSDFALWMWSVQADPDSVQARENLIWTYLDRNEFGKAEEQLRYIAEHGMQTTPNVAVNFGVAYYRIGRFDDALYYYKKAYEKRDALIPSQVSNLLSNMAIAYAVMGDEERTRSHVLQSLDVEKKNWVALSQLLAFCGEQKIDLTPYTESSLARASASAQDVRKVVARYQQVKLEKGDFCPFP